ncbi:MAG TPA: DedA family protein [Aquihabitans sp.]|nr:DedA family protein [Aquihabitans sp.]
MDQIAALAAWALVIVFAVAALDAVVPVVPSEGVIITASVLAARGDASITGIVLAAAAGALAGDVASYAIGRHVRTRRGGVLPGGRTGKAVTWARRMLEAHGPGTLIVARFVPGGRTAATFTAGFVGMRLRSYVASVGLGAVLWAGQASAIGFLGGRVFEDNLVLGIALGLGTGVAVGLVVELTRSRLTVGSARAAARAAAPAEAPTACDGRLPLHPVA